MAKSSSLVSGRRIDLDPEGTGLLDCSVRSMGGLAPKLGKPVPIVAIPLQSDRLRGVFMRDHHPYQA